MCGIAGFTMFKPPAADATGLVARMADVLAHRGPDGRGFFMLPSVALGHRRLRIIDPEGGTQPMVSPNGNHVLVSNGELYNYVELRREMEDRGNRFSTRSDTEVLLRALIPDPVAALPRLDGMFAFAFWDDLRQKLFLVRDRFGIKPLYYAIRNGDILFASEPKALLLHPLVSREMDPSAIDHYFAHGHVPSPISIYRDIRKLEPGHFLLFGPRGVERHEPYWAPPVRSSTAPESSLENCAAGVRERLRLAVRRQLRSDVPIGVFLSGGIDSSAIAALACQECAPPLHTFSIGFAESSFDESPYSLAVANHCQTHHHHEILHARQAATLLPKALDILDEPFGDPSLLPTFSLSSLARRTVKVVLGGDGGDELFGGYPAFRAHVPGQFFSLLPLPLQERLAQWAERLPVSRRYASASALLNLFFKGRGLPPEARFLVWMGGSPPSARQSLFSPGLRDSIQGQLAAEDLIPLAPPDTTAFDRLQAVALKLYLQDGVLAKVDRASMAHGLEVRVPFLDPDLFDFSASIPARHKMDIFHSKRVLKHAMRNLLPARILRRRKAGFMFPLDAWLANEFLPQLRDSCSEDRLSKQGLFNPGVVRILVEEHVARRRNHGRMLWSLLVFQHWMDRHEAGYR